MAGATVLVYNLDLFAMDRLRAVCDGLGIRVRRVASGEYGQPIGALAGIPVRRATKDAPAAHFSEPMLVMGGMLADQLDAFLAALREAGVRISLKAVLTPANIAWSSAALHEELAREHAEVARRNGLPR